MPVTGGDELAELGRALNGMADALNHQATVDSLTGLYNLRHLSSNLEALISQAKRAFCERDIEMAQDLVRQDDVVDDLNRDCFRLALKIGDDADKREWAMTMLLAARAIERIADNAVDIGEQVAFVVTGLFREFEDASHPAGFTHG